MSVLTKKLTESKWLAISNLPRTVTKETIKKYFQRYGCIQSIHIDSQRFAFIKFSSRHSASKAHHAENILDNQPVRTAFHDGSSTVPEILLNKPSSLTSSIIKPSAPSPSSINFSNKAITMVHDERNKRTSRSISSPEENTRHQVVPIERDLKRRLIPGTNSKETTPTCESKKYQRHSVYEEQIFRQSKTRILKIYQLPSTLSNETLREKLRKIFTSFKNPSHLLTIRIVNDYALLTFQEPQDVDKALLYVITKSINGIRLKAEPYNNLITDNEMSNTFIYSDIDEYSSKSTRTLFIRNLPTEISYHELREICMEYGEIIDVNIKRNSQTQAFASIQYTSIKSVVSAIKILERKLIYGRSLQLNFGKSQITNVLWLDELPGDITEANMREFLHRVTSFPPKKFKDIYIDYRHEQKYTSEQCLVYCIDSVTAQSAIDLIRGQIFDGKRLQVDFASSLFIEQFADLIRQTNEKKNNSQRTYPLDRRYSKISDSDSSIIPSNLTSSNPYHSPSSDQTFIEQTKVTKSEPNNIERIFDWLMVNETQSDSKEFHVKKQASVLQSNQVVFRTRNIPLESDRSLIQSDIRLKVYASMTDQFPKPIHLPFPEFAKTLMKSSSRAMILNPKAHLRHLSAELNNNNEDLPLPKELDERIRRLDQRIGEVNQQNSFFSSVERLPTNILSKDQQKSSTEPSSPISTTSTQAKQTSESRGVTFQQSIPIPVINNQPTMSETQINSSLKLPYRLSSSFTLKAKPNPPSVSVITNNSLKLPIPSSVTPQSLVLKSILKKPSATTRETRKAVQIVSTHSSPTPNKTRISVQNEKKSTPPIVKEPNKSQIQPRESCEQLPISSKHTNIPSLSKIPKKANVTPADVTKPKVSKETLQSSANTQTAIKSSKMMESAHESMKTSVLTPIKKTTSLHDENRQEKKKLLIPMKSVGKTIKKSMLKSSVSMYDRIKRRSQNDLLLINTSSTKTSHSSDKNKDLKTTSRLKRCNPIPESSESDDDVPSKVETKQDHHFGSATSQPEERQNQHNCQTILEVKELSTESVSNKRALESEIDTPLKKQKIEPDDILIIEEGRVPNLSNSPKSLPVAVIDLIPNSPPEEIKVDDQSIDLTIEEPNDTTDSNHEEHITVDSLCVPDAVEQDVHIKNQSPHLLTETLSSQDPSISNSLSVSSENQSKLASPNITDEYPIDKIHASTAATSSVVPTELSKQFDPQTSTDRNHSSTSVRLISPIFTPTERLFSPYQQHFPYPPFISSMPDSPPLSAKVPSISNNNAMLPEQQYYFGKEYKRNSIAKFPILPINLSPTSHPGYLRSNSLNLFQNTPSPYEYSLHTPSMYNSFSHFDHIYWDGYVTLKTVQAFVRTQFIAGNPQISRISINYWNTDLNHHLRISQRMRLEKSQLDGVHQHMQIDSDYCILLGEANGSTSDEIRSEQNHLKSGLIQYLNEKQAAGIVNISLPGIVQPVYVVHIFPPCQFASELLQKRAPDAYRYVIQNNLERIYLLFVITTTI
ncbi:unnamed protein product [Adineta ricciae]|uniref:Msx2-interacting protein n=1 Tax=Adineta ricciae TaxID=249248 RepID=A0A814U9Q2_ADIRI|nr:unnamed protein product [Adineta ricciae]